MANCGSEFMQRFSTWDRVDAALPKRNTTVFVTGGGSGFGVKSLMSGVIDLGMVFRELKDSEKKALSEHPAYLVGKDAVAIAVNSRNPLAQRKKGRLSDYMESGNFIRVPTIIERAGTGIEMTGRER